MKWRDGSVTAYHCAQRAGSCTVRLGRRTYCTTTAGATVKAIVDWELVTIGDPLLDLGWILATWPGEDGPRPGTVGASPWDGFPRPDELVERYASDSQRSLDHIGW